MAGVPQSRTLSGTQPSVQPWDTTFESTSPGKIAAWPTEERGGRGRPNSLRAPDASSVAVAGEEEDKEDVAYHTRAP